MPTDAAGFVRFTPVARVDPNETVEVTVIKLNGPTVTALEVRCMELAEPVVLPVRQVSRLKSVASRLPSSPTPLPLDPS